MKTTKKIIVIGTVLCLSLSASAQLKVDSNGNVGINTSSNSIRSPFSVNSRGDYSVGGIYCTSSTGIAGKFCATQEEEDRYALVADAFFEGSNSLDTSFGIKSYAGKGQLMNTGVFGGIGLCTKGCGIYGTTSALESGIIPEDSIYAGYFNGKTKVNGNLYVTGNIYGAVLGRSSSGTYSLRGTNNGNVTEMLSGLNASQYKVDAPQYRLDGLSDSLRHAVLEDHQMNSIGQQYQKKSHFALSAEKLEAVFPDLVYENEDGSKDINYMEMIPLLVQSINELSARIQELEGAKTETVRKARSFTSVGAASASTRGSVLYQNTPNPFTAQTKIHFSLPDNAPSAYIYIFDMTGKMQKQIPIDPSQQSVTINGYELSAGIYLYSLVVGGQETDTKRMILSK